MNHPMPPSKPMTVSTPTPTPTPHAMHRPTPLAARRRIAPLRATALALAITLAGCASFSPDGGFGPVESAARQQLGKDVRWARTPTEQGVLHDRVQALLAKPLTVDDAVQVALLNNRGLQAAFFELGITEAEMVQAGRLANPGVTFGRLERGSEVELERGFHVNLARLLFMPMVVQREARRFRQTQASVTMQVLSLAAETRKAHVMAVAAEEAVRYRQQVQEAADAGAELARRMAQAGNFTPLQQLREQAFYAEATQGLAQAQQASLAARERLTRLLGVWGEQTRFQLPARLPDLPVQPRELPDVERVAMAQRLDVQAARLDAEQTARNLGLSKATRFVNVLELGWVHNTSNEEPLQRGWEVGVELPLFDWGSTRVARAEAVYMQSLERAAQAAVEARSQVREAYGGYRSAWDIARHQRDEVVPLHQRIGEENVLRYNGMLIGVFELLADARSQIASVNGAIDALRDFWLAQAELDKALLGPIGATASGAADAPTTTGTGAAAAGGH